MVGSSSDLQDTQSAQENLMAVFLEEGRRQKTRVSAIEPLSLGVCVCVLMLNGLWLYIGAGGTLSTTGHYQ